MRKTTLFSMMMMPVAFAQTPVSQEQPVPAPAVATVVDVTGLVIYFSMAKVFMLGVLP